MDRIREALQRAKREREDENWLLDTATAVNGLGVNDSRSAKKVSQIVYTQTRTADLNAHKLRRHRIVSPQDSDRSAEAYKILRAQILQRMQENGWNALAVTSAGAGEGKSLTAINLAFSMAMEVDKTVLLVDADLRSSGLAEILGLPPGPGLSDYLQSEVPLSDILVHPGIGRCVVLPGGKPLKNSSELLASRKMAQLVQELKTRYPSRYVIFDLPPLLNAADVLAFSPLVDCALLVVEDACTTREEVQRAAQLLRSTNLIGSVLNKSRNSSSASMPAAAATGR